MRIARTVRSPLLHARTVVVVLLLAHAEGCRETAAPTSATGSTEVLRPSAEYVYVSDATGQNARILAPGGWPSWSPDSRRIAYHTVGSVHMGDVRLIDADGSNAVLLTPGAYPSWSPDGRKIVFVNEAGISVTNADGTGAPTTLIRNADYFDGLSKPVWSPDGSRIAFVVSGLELDRAYVMRADGSEVRALTDDWDGSDPTWLPDGSALLFWRAPQGIVSIDSAGREQTIIGDLSGARWPRPSFDGRAMLTYTAYAQGAPNILLVRLSEDPATTCGRLLCFDPGAQVLIANARDAVWSPNGQGLAFVSKPFR
jgi:dipeptidyl aminopeptidase/acylaminoacyl peptidase